MRLVLASILAVLLASCGGGSHPPGDGEVGAASSVAVYDVRGVVGDLAPEDQPRDWILIQHEAIPGFLGIGGDPEPMHAMTMRFPVAEGVDLSEIAIGDKIAFELEIDWDAGEPARVLSVSSLPAETALDLDG